MKKKVYVLDEYVSSQKNGIGTFLSEFLYVMSRFDVDLCVLIFNADVENFTLVEEEGIQKMLFPPFLLGDFTDNPEIVVRFFKLYIPDSSMNVFFVNHSPCNELLKMMKGSHPLSKLIFTIHDLGWTSAYMGDVDKFVKVVGNEEENGIVHEEDKPVVDYYKREKAIYESVDRLICLSDDTKELLLNIYGVDLDKIAFIANGLRPEEESVKPKDWVSVRKKLFISENDRILLFVGRPTPQKGLYALLRAFGTILKEIPEVRLVIAGINWGNMENLITETSLFATRVTFTGFIGRERLRDWYSVAEVGIIPSYYEQCSYTGIEMMMHGLPVVASDGYGLRNMFYDKLNARIARIGDRKNNEEFSRNIADTVLELMTSKSTRTILSEGAKTVYRSKYHIDKMINDYRLLLESL